MDGLTYLLDLAGQALAQSNAKIGALEDENRALREQLAAATPAAEEQQPPEA